MMLQCRNEAMAHTAVSVAGGAVSYLWFEAVVTSNQYLSMAHWIPGLTEESSIASFLF